VKVGDPPVTHHVQRDWTFNPGFHVDSFDRAGVRV